MAKIPLAVQLYTVRDLTSKDFAGTIKQVAQIGYAGVELAGFGNLKTPQEAKKVLDDAGLKVCGSHTGIEQMESELNKVMDTNEAVGNKTLVCPWMPDTRRKDAAGWKRVAQSLNQIAAAAQKRGFALAYHNHDFEFQKFDGQTGMDILLGNSDPKLLKAELDLFWVKFAGLDPVSYINQVGQRALLLHLKDMTAGTERKFAEVGNGILDFKAIVAAGQKQRVQWYIVEQDNTYNVPPIQAITTSYNNLKKLGLI